jgi:AbrB family looped-hinge helix DNA binding protein
MGVATITSKGQLTIPADVRAEFGIEPGHKLYFFKRLDGQLGVKIVKPLNGAGFGALRDFAGQAASLDTAISAGIDAAIQAKITRSEPLT